MPRKALLRIEVVACELAVGRRFIAVGVVGMAGYVRISIWLSVYRLVGSGNKLGYKGTSLTQKRRQADAIKIVKSE